MSDLHKYERFRTRKGRTIWVCKVPGCSHTLNQELMIEGKFSVCWSCEKPFLIQDYPSGYATRPVCEQCQVKDDNGDPNMRYPYLSPEEFREIEYEDNHSQQAITRLLKELGFRDKQRPQ